MHRVVMVATVQRQRIGGAARQHHLVAGHAAADLRQAHRIAGQAGRVDRITDRQFRIMGHDLGRLGQGFLERIGGVVGWFAHLTSPVAGMG